MGVAPESLESTVANFSAEVPAATALHSALCPAAPPVSLEASAAATPVALAAATALPVATARLAGSPTLAALAGSLAPVLSLLATRARFARFTSAFAEPLEALAAFVGGVVALRAAASAHVAVPALCRGEGGRHHRGQKDQEKVSHVRGLVLGSGVGFTRTDASRRRIIAAPLQRLGIAPVAGL